MLQKLYLYKLYLYKLYLFPHVAQALCAPCMRTSLWLRMRQHTSAYVAQALAYVSIRRHACAQVSWFPLFWRLNDC